MRLSEFHRLLLWLVIAVMLWIISSFTTFNGSLWDEHGHNPWIVTTIIPAALAFLISVIFIIEFHFDVPDFVVFRYKVQKRSRKNRYGGSDIVKYEAKVLMIWFFFIPHWRHVERKYHSVSGKNLFGGPAMGLGWYDDTTFDTPEEAKEVILDHKERARENRGEFFERPKKEIVDIDYY